MPSTKSGLATSFTATHRNGKTGQLISRQASVEAPVITCMRPRCLRRYMVKSLAYMLLMLYHKKRVNYAERKRNEDIPSKYRTGDNAPSGAPSGVFRTLWEIIKIKLRR